MGLPRAEPQILPLNHTQPGQWSTDPTTGLDLGSISSKREKPPQYLQSSSAAFTCKRTLKFSNKIYQPTPHLPVLYPQGSQGHRINENPVSSRPGRQNSFFFLVSDHSEPSLQGACRDPWPVHVRSRNLTSCTAAAAGRAWAESGSACVSSEGRSETPQGRLPKRSFSGSAHPQGQGQLQES